MKQIFYFLIFFMVAAPYTVLSQSDNKTKALINTASSKIKLHSFSIVEKNNKAYLQWVVADNETVNYFELERSIDGIKFTKAALVFGSEETGNEIYNFFEPIKKGKAVYRLKMFNKNLEIEYSGIIALKM